MNNKRKTYYSQFHKFTALFLMVALVWLTISTPFVFNAQKAMAEHQHLKADQSPVTENEEESNPFGNTTEEKAPSSNVLSEEFLHDCNLSHYVGLVAASFHKCENAGIYVAFHGELHVPPPNMG